jgi:hypothetical protein
MWRLWWTKWHQRKFKQVYFGYLSQSTFHQSYTFISISTSETFNRTEQAVYYYNFFILTLKFLSWPGIWMDSRVRKFDHIFALRHSILCSTHTSTNVTAGRQQTLSPYTDDQWNKSKGKVVSVLNWLSTIPYRYMGEWRYISTYS